MMDGYSEVIVRDVGDLRVGDLVCGLEVVPCFGGKAWEITGLTLSRIQTMLDNEAKVQRKVEPEAPIEFTIHRFGGLKSNRPGDEQVTTTTIFPLAWLDKPFREVRTLSEEQLQKAYCRWADENDVRIGLHTSYFAAWQAAIEWATGAKVETAPEIDALLDETKGIVLGEAQLKTARIRAGRATSDPSPVIPLVAKLRELRNEWVDECAAAAAGPMASVHRAAGIHECLQAIQALLDSYQEEVRTFVPARLSSRSTDIDARAWVPQEAIGRTCYYTVEKQEGGKS